MSLEHGSEVLALKDSDAVKFAAVKAALAVC
jgi:hypothetical protein